MRKNIVLIAVLIFSVVSSLSAIFSPQWFFTHDFVHGARVVEYARGLTDGQLPVIWSKNFGYGYGMPLFLFYAPLPYFIGSLFYLVGVDLITIVKILYILLTIISVTGVFLLVRKMFNTSSGLLAAIIYVLTPYRAVNLYVRGAVSESFGMAFAPFVLWGVILAWQKKWFGGLVLALSLSLVALSHNLSLLLILPVAVVWFLYLIWQDYHFKLITHWAQIWPKASSVIWGMGLGLGISSFYLVPAAYYQSLTKLQQIVLSGYSDYRHHFLYIRQFFDNFWGYGGSNWGPSDDMSFFLGYGPLFGLGFIVGNLLARTILSIYHKHWWFHKNSPQLVFMTLLGVFCLLFTTPKLQLLWDNIAILPVLQFPWRFLGLVTLILAIIGGGCLTLIKLKWQKFYLVALILLSLSVVPFFQPASRLTNNQDLYYDDPSRIARQMSEILPDYIPKQTPDKVLPATQPIYASSLAPISVKLINWSSNRLVIELNQYQPTLTTLSVANFPGWRAKINRSPVTINTSNEGLVVLLTPSGASLLEVEYHLTGLQLISLTISLFSLLILVVISYYDYRKNYGSNRT